MRIILKHRDALLKDSAAFDVDVLITINEDIVYIGILEERLEGAEAKNFVKDLPRQSVFFRRRHWGIQYFNEVLNDGEYLGTDSVIPVRCDFCQVYFSDEITMDSGLELLIFLKRETGAPFPLFRPSGAGWNEENWITFKFAHIPFLG
jgi:hypothetical protein